MNRVYMFFADGFEEVEALTSIDLLRRAGIEVSMVSVTGKLTVTGSHGIPVTTDLLFEDLSGDADMVILPGGMPGTLHLREHEGLAGLLERHYEGGRWTAAICAAPSVLAKLGFLAGRKCTSYPGALDDYPTGPYLEDPVVIDGHVITSRGVGTAIPFALTLITCLMGKEKADQIAASIVYQ